MQQRSAFAVVQAAFYNSPGLLPWNLMIGTQLGHFRILDQLGAGGMAEVYLAEDLTLNRRVALKLLPPALADDPNRLSRFDREAKTLAALNHPNIVTIYSVEQDQGHHFLTMELVEGETLAMLIRESRIPPERYRSIAIAITDALAAAHARGVVHRDLKPANVIVDSSGWVKVVDFGLAQIAPWEEGLEEAPTLAMTREGYILGTIPYMSPEQVQGKGVDARSDIFSLGIILYEMATGSHPFPGESSAHVMSAILRDRPPLVRQLRGDFAPAWEPVIGRCLEKDPKDRYQSASELRQELEDLPSAISPRLPILSGGRWRRRLRLLIGTVASALVVAALVLGIRLWQQGRIEIAPAATEFERTMLVVLPFENIGPAENGYFVAGVTEEITSRLGMVGSLGIISRKSALHYAETTKSAREIGEELDVDYILDGSVRWSVDADGKQRVRITPQLIRVADDTGLWVDTFDREITDIFQVQSDIAEAVFSQLNVTLADPERELLQAQPTDNIEAYQAYLRGRILEQLPNYSSEHRGRVIAMYQQSVELDPTFVSAYLELATAHSFFHHLGHDLSAERKTLAKSAIDAAYALAPNASEVRLALGFYHYWVQTDYEAALEEFENAESGLPSNADVLEAKALVYRRLGRWDEALDYFHRALKLNPLDASVVGDLAETYANIHRYEEAIRLYDQAIALAPQEAWLYLAKTWAYWIWKGATAEARATLEQTPTSEETQVVWSWFWQEIFEGAPSAALARLEEFPGVWIGFTESYSPKSLLAGHAYRFMGEEARTRASYDEARDLLEEEVRLWPEDPRRHAALGIAYGALGLKQEAIREGRRAVELHPMSKDAFSGAYYVSELAFIYTLVGESELAMDLIEELLAVPSPLSTSMLRLDPRWDPLRGLPRFERLLHDSS